MILVDANILIYSYNRDASQHSKAAAWLEDAFAGTEAIRIPSSVLHTFLRLTTAGRVVRFPVTASAVIDVIDEWLALPNVGTVDPGDRYWPIFRSVVLTGQARGDLIMDAHLAALAIENDATLCTADRDFARFEGVRLLNPISA